MEDQDPFVPKPPPASASASEPASGAEKKAPNYQSGSPILEDYQDVAEKIGMVPDFDAKRNWLQLKITAPFGVIGFFVGFLIKDVTVGLFVAGLGLLVGVLISGFVLLILGLMKKKKTGE